MKLYLATGNAHKLSELRSMLAEAGLPMKVLSPAALGGMPEVEEDRETFRGNALKKASALAELLPLDETDSWALADDSGLCVDALDGAPGVYSARYAGPEASDQENVDKLLRALGGLSSPDRVAAFQCHLALVSSAGRELVFEGSCSGRIAHEPRGEGGFGYDPVFVPHGFESSFAELTSAEKATLSHRGIAMRQLVDWLRRL